MASEDRDQDRPTDRTARGRQQAAALADLRGNLLDNRSTRKKCGFWIVLFAALLCSVARAETGVSYEISKVAEGTAWVSSYWGYNAPKLVYDGNHYYTVGLWGAEQAAATGALYGFRDGKWEQGYTWDGLNYQPGMLLLDNEQRLVLIYARMNEGPVILRGRAKGDIENFESIAVPAEIGKAGYIGAGIYDNRIVLGYIGDPETYSFNIAILDLETMEWNGPHLLAISQRLEEPWTTWLYPIILPDANGFHLAVSNQPDPTASYDTILYLYLPYDGLDTPTPEVVAQVDPWSGNMAFAEAMWRRSDGSIYITGQYKPEGGENGLQIYRRDPQTKAWHAQRISTAQIGAVFEDRGGRLWMTSTYWDALRLYTGDNWQVVDLPEFAEHGLVSSFFLHGIHPGSGSLIPEGPAVVFSAGTHPEYQLWFVQFDLPTAVTAVAEANSTPPRDFGLAQNAPNPVNKGTAIDFWLPTAGQVDLAMYNLVGQRVALVTSGHHSAGRNEVIWNGLDLGGRPLAAGVYFYRLRYAGLAAVRKLVLLP